MLTRRIVTGLLLLVLTSCSDVLHISNAGGPVGVLLDGQDDTGNVNDRGYITTASKIDVTYTAGTSNEVVGFTNARPPRLVTTPWTNEVDYFDLDFRPLIQVPVTVWIVKGPFVDQQNHAIEACIRTSTIWNAERMGVDFSQFEVLDATGNPKASAHFAFPNGDVGDSVWKPLRDDIGFTAGRLNIYWVDTVNGLTTNGWSNFGAQIAIGRNSGDELLSHEIGHAFSLTHTDADSNFDDTNVMWSASNRRQYLTEGQLFRAHLDPTSILNDVYDARPGETTRSCPYAPPSESCPAIDRRLWADGTFPPN
jgi:hypothetical protein